MTNNDSETGSSRTDPTGANLEPGWIDRALPPPPQLAADLSHLRFQGQAGLPVDVQAPVVSSSKQDGHAPAVGWVVEHLDLQALIVGVVGDLEVQHSVDGPHLQVERAQQLAWRSVRGRSDSRSGIHDHNHLPGIVRSEPVATGRPGQGQRSRPSQDIRPYQRRPPRRKLESAKGAACGPD
jgi:hypothetical protein